MIAYEKNIEYTDLGGGVRRRVLAYEKEMMLVEVAFEAGATGAAHTHPHAQISYVLSGDFIYTIDGAEHKITAGDSVFVPCNAVHGTKAITQGALLDSFSPMREDFI